MRYGLLLDANAPITEVTEEVRRAAEAGFASVSVSQIFGYDALTLLAVVGQQVPDIELATAVVPTYPRHPVVLAGQALTVQAAVGSRLTLGIGLSHKVVIEGVFGYSFDRPVRHMRDYLGVLVPLLRGEQVTYKGATLEASTFDALDIEADSPTLLLAALGPAMLRLAGEMADGTVTWMTGPATLAEHTVPVIAEAAERVGRREPRVVVGLPVCVTSDVDRARERAGQIFALYGQLPSYRAMLDREGAEGPADVAVVGDEEAVRRQISRVRDAGATDFTAAAFGSREERQLTVRLLAELARGA